MSAIRILLLDIDPKFKTEIAKTAPQVEFVEASVDLERLVEPISPPPAMVFCGLPKTAVALTEIAQVLRSVYLQVPTYVLLDTTQKLDRVELIKNGMTDVFFLPLDTHPLKKAIEDGIAAAGQATRMYREVKLADVRPDTQLDFDTYLFLPANRKHILFSKAGDPIDAERTTRLKTKSVNALSVRVDEMKNFYSYVAQTLRMAGSDSGMSETERAERAEGAVRNLLTGLFSDKPTSMEAGKQTIADLQGVIKDYLKAGDPGQGSFYNRILALATQGPNSYSHAVSVSTLASLFAIGLNIGSVEEIATAGILHDLGLAQIPQQILDTPPDQWLPVDRELYETHPEKSIAIIRDRKLIVSEEVHKIILQHHEKFGGGGFPKNLSGNRICIGAQMLAIADEFDELITPVEGKVSLKPLEAIDKMLQRANSNPALSPHDPVLLAKISLLMRQG